MECGSKLQKLSKERLDKVLIDKGIVQSRERARALIMAGKVMVKGKKVDKAGEMVLADADIVLAGEDIPYVSRGGLKLEKALDEFKIDVSGKVAMDVGASTGGFTDCLLQRGARKVYAVDVGYGQLDLRLRNDHRVVNIERQNIRYLDRGVIPEDIDLVTIDSSFISLVKIIPKAVEFIGKYGILIALIKPQFEVGKGEVGKGGVVRDETKQKAVVEKIKGFCTDSGLSVIGVVESPIFGPKGNREFLIYAIKG
ncbi:MAG: TlyA family RNA methyltransferase [Deltaproteobacteria bacterium]|nr:TlyA family RNA methyltransferase [Deltaproteobacteria bacterium]